MKGDLWTRFRFGFRPLPTGSPVLTERCLQEPPPNHFVNADQLEDAWKLLALKVDAKSVEATQQNYYFWLKKPNPTPP